MILYNAKNYSGGYRITKFNDSLDVEASYLIKYVDASPICDCPSWPRKSHCKHIDMLEKFRRRGYVDTEWFLNADTGGWHQPLQVGEVPYPKQSQTETVTYQYLTNEPPMPITHVALFVDAPDAGEGPVPSTLAATRSSSPSQESGPASPDLRGEPAPEPIRRRTIR